MDTNINQATQLFPTLQTLPRIEKLRMVQFLISQLAQEEGIELLELQQGQYPIWTPYNAFQAADTLLNLLNEDQKSGGQHG